MVKVYLLSCVLYIFSLLQQATTAGDVTYYGTSCISFLFFNKPQLCVYRFAFVESCISFLFFNKPQQEYQTSYFVGSCISFLFFNKPQLKEYTRTALRGCISFLFFNKPQLLLQFHCPLVVVYLFSSSTSHNCSTKKCNFAIVVYLFSSSTSHNT